MHADDPALNAEHLDALISLWLETIAADVAPATLAGYRQKIEHFRQWWKEAGPACGWKLTRRKLAEFGRSLAATPSSRPPHRPPSYGQQADVIRRLRQMFRWAKAAGYTDIDHGDWLPKPAGEPTKRKAPPRSPATVRRVLCFFRTHHPTPAPRQQLPRRRHLQDAGPAFWGDDRIGNLDHLPQLIKRHTEHRCSLSSRNAANILDGAGDH